MTIKFKTEETKKAHVVFIRLNETLFTEIGKLVKRHDVDRSTVIRRLIEEGLKNAV